MSHKLGEAKPLISRKKIFQLGGLTAVALLVSIFIFGKGRGWFESKPKFSGTTQDSRDGFLVDRSAMPPVHLLPKSAGPIIRFNAGRQIVLPLTTNQWSQQIVLPVHPTKWVDCRIDVEPPTGYFVQFQDGHTEWVRADQREYADHGVRRGIFRLVGTSPGQKATVTISFRSEEIARASE